MRLNERKGSRNLSSYDAIESAVKAYWKENYPQDVVAFFYQKYSFDDRWEWCEELVECCGNDDYENMVFLNDFCEGQTDVKNVVIASLHDVTNYYAEHQLLSQLQVD